MKVMLATWTPGPAELLVIGVVALLLFGRRLPEVARSLGRSITSFKKGLKDVEDEVKTGMEEKEHTGLEPPADAAKEGKAPRTPNS
jgi:sec-independent protein translocase protein TatA